MTVGESRLITATFKDTSGTLVDPSTVDLTVRDPDGTETTPAVANPSVGVYTATVTFDEAGIWRWRWEGATEEGTVAVECSECVTPSSVLVSS